jgi:hypothetical protein
MLEMLWHLQRTLIVPVLFCPIMPVPLPLAVSVLPGLSLILVSTAL